MPLRLPPAHRLAQINHLSRTVSFGYALIVAVALAAERSLGPWTYVLALATFLLYPQAAYLHARLAHDSKRAEFRNLDADSILMGAWASHVDFALLPALGAVVAISLDNAVCGGLRLFGRGLVGFAAGAAALGALEGFRWNPDTGPLVSALAVVGILGYVTALGDVFHVQNKNLVHTRDSLRSSEAQFRFIAEHAGDLVAVIGADGILQYASPSYAEHYDPERSAPGRDWLELVHPDDRGKAGRFLAYLRASMKQDRAELRMAMAGRAARRFECQGNPVAETGGGLRMIVLVCREVAGRARDDGPAA
ncbi:MAG TPA: MASE2 domain-containing protein [Burkholderiales bacterium]|nr:MASE2 domain-containing protein [Burkholderiales bacterium]